MPCKHEGGRSKCEKYEYGGCKAAARMRASKYAAKFPEKTKKARAEYRKTVTQYSSSFSGQDRGKSTAACELLVRADLSKRGYEVTVPVSPTARHDLHVELPSVGWRGVQVKAGVLNVNTNYLRSNSNRPVQSPIYAIVHLPTNQILYRPGTEPLPPELL